MPGSALVLDFDGTILDTEEPVYRSWAELWADHGEELTVVEWQATIGTADSFDPWRELEARLGRALDPALATRRRARRDALQARHAPRPDVLAWIDEADRLGLPVGIASSSEATWVDGHLRRHGLRHRFATLACRSEAVPPKPDPTSYRLACERIGADPARSVAVEDSPHGVAAATAAGLFTVACPHALTADLDLSGADLVVATLAALDLADVVGRARSRAGRGRAVT